MTQHEIIFKVLEDANDWVPSYNLIKIDTAHGWLGTSADRIARYMTDPRQACYNPDVERKTEGKYAYYRVRETDRQKEIELSAERYGSSSFWSDQTRQSDKLRRDLLLHS